MKKDKKKKKLDATNAAISGGFATSTAFKTNKFNEECGTFRDELRTKTMENQSALEVKLHADPTYVGDRSKGVRVAYEYEVADVKMGGRGSANWTKDECSELIATGKVRRAEGHHENNVANHPELQTNPDNITFFKNKESHIKDGHGGDFRNESSGPLYDKDKMLVKTNTKRVLANEAKGLGLAVASGTILGVGESIVDTCKEEGTSIKSVAKGVKKSAKPVARSVTISVGSYTLGRVLSFTFDHLFK